jgi:hypothetical protein
MYRITQYDQVDRIIEETIEPPYVDNYHTAKDLSRKHSKRRYQNQVKAKQYFPNFLLGNTASFLLC